MSNNNTKTKAIVPMGQKIAFGLGMLANQMFPAALGIFMVVLVENLGMPPWMWGITFFLPRILDAFIDPIMGFISDNTRSKWGRRRQYVFIGAIIMGISFVVMWQLYREKLVSFSVDLLLIKIAGTIANIIHEIPTQTAKVLVAVSAFGNQLGSYITTQNQGAITQAHCPIHCEMAIILVLS